MTKPSKIRAFTLIELLVVIAIIAILTSVVIAAIAPSKAKARDAKRISDLGQIQLALELYFDRCRSYPNEASGGGVDLTSSCSTSNGTVNLNSFIAQIPLDPNGQPYDYLIAIANSVPVDYILHTKLEYPNDAQKNSLPNVSTSGGWSLNSFHTAYDPNTQGWSGGSCYVAGANPPSLDYCLSPR